MGNLPFLMFAAECEGDSAIDTRQSRINRFIKMLAACDDPNDPEVQRNCAYECGFLPDSITSYEREYIEREVERRL